MAYVPRLPPLQVAAAAAGQQWVRVDNDFLLISLATGVIAGLASAY